MDIEEMLIKAKQDADEDDEDEHKDDNNEMEHDILFEECKELNVSTCPVRVVLVMVMGNPSQTQKYLPLFVPVTATKISDPKV